MLTLYDSEERAKEFELLGPALDDESTRKLLLYVRKILTEKNEFEAVGYLDRLNFGPETAAEEHEQCRVFKRLGARVCEIFDARRCWNNPDAVVEDFLRELARS